MLAMSSVPVSTRRAASASATSKERRPPKPGYRTTSAPPGGGRGARRSRRRSRSGARPGPRASRAREAGARRCPPRAPGPCASGTRGAARHLRRRLQTTAPRSASSWPARYFVAEWTAMSQPSSSGRTCERRRGRRVADDARRMRRRRLEARHREERVRRGLEPDEIDAVGRRAGLVELDRLDAPAARARRACTRCRSRRPPRARPSDRGRASARITDVHAAAPDEKSSASPPSSSPSRRSASAIVGLPKRE